MKTLKITGRIIIGLVFMFSGFVKAVDPLGSAYKFHDYFHAFNVPFLDSISLPLAIILCSVEFLAGFSVLTAIRLKEGLFTVLILLIIFTPLTFFLGLKNPVSDCGCFGDAIHLTNWQTFGKNIILCLLLIVPFSERNNVTGKARTNSLIIISSAAFLIVAFCIINLRYLPVIDFLPFKKGVKIADKMVIPAGVATNEYKTTFIYEKNGNRKEFTLQDYPANDTSWKFIDQKSVLVKKGYVPPIHDFIITSLYGENLTNNILTYNGYSVLMISKKLGEANKRRLSDGFKLGNYCMAKGVGFYVLTSSGTDEMRSHMNGLIFCSVDETTLKTMIRSNPGYILLRDGRIAGKWSWANVPDAEWFAERPTK